MTHYPLHLHLHPHPHPHHHPSRRPLHSASPHRRRSRRRCPARPGRQVFPSF